MPKQQPQRGQGCCLFAATPTTFSRREPMQPTRQTPQRPVPPDRPGRRATSAVFSPKGGPFPAAASLLLLRAEDIEANPGQHFYACGNQVRYGTSPLPHRVPLAVRMQRPPSFQPATPLAVPSSRGPRATESTIPANNNSLQQLPISYPSRHQAPRLRCPGLPGTSPSCEAVQRCCHPSR